MGFSGFAKDSRSTGTDLMYYTCKREQISQLLVAKYVELRTHVEGYLLTSTTERMLRTSGP